jgi:hypothetical protein
MMYRDRVFSSLFVDLFHSKVVKDVLVCQFILALVINLPGDERNVRLLDGAIVGLIVVPGRTPRVRLHGLDPDRRTSRWSLLG